jgi:hypothetical protein
VTISYLPHGVPTIGDATVIQREAALRIASLHATIFRSSGSPFMEDSS